MFRTARLGELLVQAGALSQDALSVGLERHRESEERLGRVLVASGLAGPEDVARALAQQMSLPYAPPTVAPEADACALVEGAVARRLSCVPMRTSGRELSVALEDPLDLDTVSAIEFHSGRARAGRGGLGPDRGGRADSCLRG